MSADFNIRDAVEMAAGASNDRQTPIDIPSAGFASVGKKRLSTARHIIGRFLELAPDGMSVMELREQLDQEMPALFTESP